MSGLLLGSPPRESSHSWSFDPTAVCRRVGFACRRSGRIFKHGGECIRHGSGATIGIQSETRRDRPPCPTIRPPLMPANRLSWIRPSSRNSVLSPQLNVRFGASCRLRSDAEPRPVRHQQNPFLQLRWQRRHNHHQDLSDLSNFNLADQLLARKFHGSTN